MICDPFLNTGITLASLRLLGTMPVEMEVLKRISNGLEITLLIIFNIETNILKGPVALSFLRISFSISIAVVGKM